MCVRMLSTVCPLRSDCSIQVKVVPIDADPIHKEGDAPAASDGELPRKKSRVMMLQIRQKGELYLPV